MRNRIIIFSTINLSMAYISISLAGQHWYDLLHGNFTREVWFLIALTVSYVGAILFFAYMEFHTYSFQVFEKLYQSETRHAQWISGIPITKEALEIKKKAIFEKMKNNKTIKFWLWTDNMLKKYIDRQFSWREKITGHTSKDNPLLF